MTLQKKLVVKDNMKKQTDILEWNIEQLPWYRHFLKRALHQEIEITMGMIEHPEWTAPYISKVLQKDGKAALRLTRLLQSRTGDTHKIAESAALCVKAGSDVRDYIQLLEDHEASTVSSIADTINHICTWEKPMVPTVLSKLSSDRFTSLTKELRECAVALEKAVSFCCVHTKGGETADRLLEAVQEDDDLESILQNVKHVAQVKKSAEAPIKLIDIYFSDRMKDFTPDIRRRMISNMLTAAIVGPEYTQNVFDLAHHFRSSILARDIIRDAPCDKRYCLLLKIDTFLM